MKKKTRIMPWGYVFLSLFLIILLHFLLPVKKIIVYPYNLSGILVLMTGYLLNKLSSSELEKHNTTTDAHIEPDTLVTSGIYRYSRNPMYLGAVCTILGIVILLGSASPFIIF